MKGEGEGKSQNMHTCIVTRNQYIEAIKYCNFCSIVSREYLFSDSEAQGQNVNFIRFRFLVESERFYRSELSLEGV